MHTKLLFAFLIVTGLPIMVAGQESLCDAKLDGPIASLEYLRSERASLQPACVIRAIRKVDMSVNDGVEMLIRYLDFRRPQTEAEKAGVFLRPQIFEELYPAADKLSQLGEAIVPALTRLIITGDGSELARENAVHLMVDIFRLHPERAVVVLAERSRLTSDRAGGERASRAANAAVAFCAPSKRAACFAALTAASELK